jgi:hypothetical protein
MRFRPFMAFAALPLALGSIAEARPNTTTMSCGEAAATVARAGAIVLTTGDHSYERFVAATTFCLGGETTAPGIAPTLDSERCQVGYICRERPNLGNNK